MIMVLHFWAGRRLSFGLGAVGLNHIFDTMGLEARDTFLHAVRGSFLYAASISFYI